MQHFKLIIIPFDGSVEDTNIKLFNNEKSMINFFIDSLNFTDEEAQKIVNYAINNLTNQDINNFICEELKIISLNEKYYIKKVDG